MEVTIDTTITFENVMSSNERVTQHIGGTRSGKTYAILQYLLVKGLESPIDISIVRKTIPSLKRTVMKDWKDILLSVGIWNEEKMNMSDRIYHLDNGTTVSFVNTDDEQKLRGYKSSILFIDEANEVDEEAYFQLSIRTTGQIILAYNPTVSPYHWLRQMQDCERYTTTFRDNPYLPKDLVRAIEELETKSPKKWLIYGKGEFAPNDKAIYQFEIVDTIEGDFVAVGLDWGFSQDPTAVVSVFRNGDTIYLDELVYDKGMVMNDIIKRLKDEGIEREEIWCDSSEPRSVEELYRAGFNAKAVKKGPDSIKFGISVMQNYQIKVTKRSQNLINEIYSYQYATDKYGYVTDRPEDGLDHLLDASRYVAMMRLSIKQQNKGKYTLSVR
jgi:phage terminase large subunit